MTENVFLRMSVIVLLILVVLSLIELGRMRVEREVGQYHIDLREDRIYHFNWKNNNQPYFQKDVTLSTHELHELLWREYRKGIE